MICLYQKGQMKKKILLSVGLVFLVTVSLVIAYFHFRRTTTLGTYTTAEVKLDIIPLSELTVRNLLPGQEKEVKWKVVNTGTVPINLKSKLQTSFENNQLSTDVIVIKNVQRKDSHDQWQEVTMGNNIFFYSKNGTEHDLLELQPQEEIEFLTTLLLATTAGNEYQDKVIQTKFQIVAKQIDPQASWPEMEE